jgi:hypothetical protein
MKTATNVSSPLPSSGIFILRVIYNPPDDIFILQTKGIVGAPSEDHFLNNYFNVPSVPVHRRPPSSNNKKVLDKANRFIKDELLIRGATLIRGCNPRPHRDTNISPATYVCVTSWYLRHALGSPY